MDVDIDLKTDFDPTSIFDGTLASMVQNGKLIKHPAGMYFQKIPKDEITNLSAVPYKKAEKLGYYKIDMLHLSVLDYFTSKKQIRILIQKEPNWKLLEDEESVSKLFQLHRHFEIINKIKPQDIITLADCIALIRPGKRNLLSEYLKNPQEVRKVLYLREENDKYYFKKSHAIAYATTIVLQLHLINAGII